MVRDCDACALGHVSREIRMQDVIKIAESLAREDATHGRPGPYVELSCRLSFPPLLSCTIGIYVAMVRPCHKILGTLGPSLILG